MAAEGSASILVKLYEMIESRKGADPDKSYVARQFARGRARIARKVGEEAVETVVAALSEGKAELVEESADLLFHLMILWAASDVRPEQVYAALAAREGTSGLDAKKRKDGGNKDGGGK
ncbi:MAG: phosphoribosyl-ATP diphosphatase [Alphaproteobacteria bacterium]|nr:phosphoribosyl-ATP diphosphatase [Alphaproteobacteria bacterium]